MFLQVLLLFDELVCVHNLMFSCLFNVRVVVCLCAVILCNCRCNCSCVRRSEVGVCDAVCVFA